MKWKTKRYKPEEGDRRTRRRFAFLPTTADEYTVWLETYDSVQEYQKILVTEYDGAQWEMRWVEVARIPLYAYM